MKKNAGVLLIGTLFLSIGAATLGIVENENSISQVRAAGDDPSTYWSTLSATDGSVYGNGFRQELETIMISKGSSTGTNSYTALNEILKKSDTNGTSSVMAFYRDHSASSGWNKEHCWPSSRGAGENAGYAGSDPQVIRPTNTSDNSSRSNYMYAEVTNPTSASYSQSTGWDPAAFGYETARGEAARIILYAAVRYYNKNLSGAGGSYKGNATSMELTNNLNDATINGTMGKLSDLLHWNAEYAVTDVEQYRNNYLSGAISGSTYDYCRNPFIDHPEWANYIWDENGVRTSAYSTTSVSVASTSVSVNKGSNVTDQATASQFPSSVTWSVYSSDSNVATAMVSSSGLVTIHGVKGGSATITVTGTAGTTVKSATIMVTVVSTDPTITVSPSSFSIKVGNNGTATLSSTNFSGAVSYSVASSASSVATGSVSGTTLTVVPLSAGSATLTITGTYGSQSAQALVSVTIKDASSYEGTYHLVTSTDELVSGKKYLVGSTGTAGSAQFLSTSVYATYYQGVATNTINSDFSVTPNASTEVLVLGGSSSAWTFSTSVRSSNSGFLCVSGTSMNLMAVASPTSTDYKTWGISFGSAGAATVLNAGYTAAKRYLEYYAAKSEYTTYTTASIVYLYVENETKTVSSLSISSQPTKTSYFVGDTLNTSGLVVTATFGDNTTASVTSLCSFSPTTLSTAGTQTITASYGGKTATFSVTVSANTLSSIAISSIPSKTAYHVGEAFASDGLAVTATFANGSTSDVTSLCTLSPAEGTTFSSTGSKTITVSYTSGSVTKTASFTVNVTVAPTLSSIAVTTQPTKTSFTVGQAFDTAGLVVTGTYSDGSTGDVTSSCTLSPATGSTLNNAGSQTVLVTYGSFTATFGIAVAGAGGGSGYNLVTSTTDLTIGSKFIIAASGYDLAMSTTQNGNNRGQAAITKDTTAKTATFTSDSGVCEFTLQTGTTSGTYAFSDGTGYIYAASSGSNYLRTETTVSANSSWTISIENEVASIVANGTNTRNNINYNSGSSLFSCYSSTNLQKPVALYKQGSGSSSVDTSAAEASSWAAIFVATINAHCDATQQNAKTPDANFVSAWAGQKTSFEALSEAAQTLVKAEGSGDANIVSARALYNYILGKYGTASLNNFLNTEVPSAALATDVSVRSAEEGTLLVVGIMLAMGLGGIFLLKRKKQN